MLPKLNISEADLNFLPQKYINKIKKEAEKTIGISGPSINDLKEMGNLLNQIFEIQDGYEAELSKIGTDIILKQYGSILDGVELDLKIVKPDDKEKEEITKKLTKQNSSKKRTSDIKKDPKIKFEDINKRKLINNIMQGESQNVHDMIYLIKGKVSEITGNQELIDTYIKFLKLNRKFDWDEKIDLEKMISNMPQMANVMETEWKNDENGNNIPKIKVRVLDLPMLIHETVKGIYELISAGAIDKDPVMAQNILNATDTLKDEQEDIRYGPFIARDIRNYVNNVIKEIPQADNIPNIREFIFGRMIELESNQFVDLIISILLDENPPVIYIKKIIKEIQQEFNEYENDSEHDNEDDNDLIKFMKQPLEKKEVKKKKWIEMRNDELNHELNIAIDNKDWNTSQEIQKILGERKLVSESKFLTVKENINDYINENFINENIQQAKFILKKHNIPENNKDYQHIKQLLTQDNKLGFLGIFISWLFNNNSPVSEILNVYEKIKKHPKSIQNISQYKTPEKLYDFLQNEILALSTKKITDVIPKRLKNNITDKLLNLLSFYPNYSEEIRKYYLQKIESLRSPEKLYKATKLFLNMRDKFSIGKIKEKIKDNKVNIKYESDNFLILEILDYKASMALGAAAWCISTSVEQWDNYVNSFTSQYFIFDFTKSPSDKKSMIGITVSTESSGNKWNSIHWRDDTTDNSIKKYVQNLFNNLS